MTRKQLYIRPVDPKNVSVIFSFDWDVIHALREIPSRRYIAETKENWIAKADVPRLQGVLPHYTFIEKGMAKKKYTITINNEGFNIHPSIEPFNAKMSRILFLKRPRDGYELYRILKDENYEVELVDNLEGLSVQLPSSPTLYPYQEDCMEFVRNNDYTGLVSLDMGLGKMQPLHTPLLTTEGFKTIGTVKVGDYVFNRQGKPVKVVAKSQIWENRTIYEISNTRGGRTEAGSTHEWLIMSPYHNKKEKIFTTEELWKKQIEAENNNRDYKSRPAYRRPIIKIQKEVDFPEKELLIDPYILGYWLGDGNSNSSGINSSLEDYNSFLINSGLERGQRNHSSKLCIGDPKKDSRTNNYTYTIYNLLPKLKELNVFKNKHIPSEYLFSSKQQRLALLQGLMDSDGSVTKEGLNEFTSSHAQIGYGLKFILDSLGIRNGVSWNKSQLNGKRHKDRIRVNFKMKDAFRLERKRKKATDKQQRKDIYISIKKTDKKCDMQCIQVDDVENIYLTGYSLIPTKNSIIACNSMKELGKAPILIVAPSSLLHQWKDELDKHYGYDSAQIVTSKYKGTAREQAFMEHDITITNYELLRTIDLKRHYELLVLDECQRVKNWKTATAQSISKIVAKRVMGLSGTPVENHIMELYNITDQIQPAFFGTQKKFYNKYVNPYNSKYHQNLDEVYARLQALMFRLGKAEVADQLPSLTKQLITVQLTKKEETGYVQMLQQCYEEGKGLLGAMANAKVFASSSGLRMPDLKMSSKEKELTTIVSELQEKTIVFSQYKQEVARIKTIFEDKIPEKDVFVMSGDTNKEDRNTAVQNFKTSDDDSVLLMTEVGTHGLNLQFASTCINVDLPWTFARLDQRVGRIQRLGSEHDKNFLINMVTADTLDDHIMDVIERKKELFDLSIDGAKSYVASAFKEDMRSIGLNFDQNIEAKRIALAEDGHL